MSFGALVYKEVRGDLSVGQRVSDFKTCALRFSNVSNVE